MVKSSKQQNNIASSSENINELREFLETEIKKKIFIAIMVDNFTVSDISKKFDLSFQYVDRTVRWMEAKDWAESNRTDNKPTTFRVSDSILKEIISGFCAEKNYPNVLGTIKNPIVLFICTRMKKIWEQGFLELKVPEKIKIIFELSIRNSPDVANPIDAIQGLLLGSAIFKNIAEFSGNNEKGLEKFKRMLFEDEIFEKLVDENNFGNYERQLAGLHII